MTLQSKEPGSNVNFSSSIQNMKNPKVEKAEILESVVHFLRAEKGPERGHRAVEEQGPTLAGQQTYRDGMRSCLLRVSHFIASKNQEIVETSRDAVSLSDPQEPPLYPMLSPLANTAPLSPHYLLHYQQQHAIASPCLTQVTGLNCNTQELFSSMAAPQHVTNPVWRPWP